MNRSTFVELKVRGIALDPESQMPMVLLQDQERRKVITVSVGPFEASAIIIEMEGVAPPRPLTHDIISHLFTNHGFTMKYLEIYNFVDNKYLARIQYTRRLKKYTMEVRPSDGIALALRLKASILVDIELLSGHTDNLAFQEQLDPYSPEMLYLDAEQRDTPVM